MLHTQLNRKRMLFAWKCNFNKAKKKKKKTDAEFFFPLSTYLCIATDEWIKWKYVQRLAIFMKTISFMLQFSA